MSLSFRSLSLICLSALLVGCGEEDTSKKNRPKTVKATGTITYNGQPLEFASIVLSPQGQGTAAMCRSDADGNFSLDSFPPDRGAVPGTYLVSVTKSEPAKEVVYDEGSHDAPPAAELKGPKPLIPPEYGNATTSGLKLEIPAEGSDTLKLELR